MMTPIDLMEPSAALSTVETLPPANPAVDAASLPREQNPAAKWRAVVWLAVVAALYFWGRGFGEMFLPQIRHLTDFHQEWLSARNVLEGLPVYQPIPEAVAHHTGRKIKADNLVLQMNVHPPTSVLLALPFSRMSFTGAFLAWNVVSLVCLCGSVLVIAWELPNLDRGLLAGAGLLFLLGADPVLHHFHYGQLGMLLLLVLTLAWCADRHGHSTLAGVLWGLATAVKLFPGFLIVYFIARRDWRAVLAGAATFAGLTIGTAEICGLETYRDYVTVALPQSILFEGANVNASLMGLWTRLFAPTGRFGPATPLWDAPWLAGLLKAASAAAIAASIVRVGWRAAGRDRTDGVFALAVVGMLLVSPVTWEHYFVLLPLPMLLWFRQTHRLGAWLVFAGCQAVLWLPTVRVLQRLFPAAFDAQRAQAWHSATVHAVQCYALIAFLVLLACAARCEPAERDVLGVE